MSSPNEKGPRTVGAEPEAENAVQDHHNRVSGAFA